MELQISSPKLLSRKAAAAYLGVSLPTLARWAAQRRGPRYIRLAGRVRYRPSDLDAFINEVVVEPAL